MIKYNVYFKETRIGMLYVDMTQENNYSYETDERAIEKLEKEGHVLIPDVKQSKKQGTIPFFENRINDCKKFGNDTVIKYPNSDYYFVKDNSGPN